MSSLDRFLYNTIAVPLLHGGLRLVSPFDPKVRKGFRGRRDVLERLAGAMLEIGPDRVPRFWIHSSSAGEFLQALPVIQAIRDAWPDALIVYTYFSPSADPLVRSSPLIDIPSYLPADTRENAARLFSILDPDILLFSRYDVWPNLVWEAARTNRPTVLINGTLTPESLRTRWWARGFFGRLYGGLELICTATEEDRANFLSIGVPAWKVDVTGDTKYDETSRRVAELAREESPLKRALAGRRVVIGGSSWPPEEGPLLRAVRRLRQGGDDDVYLALVPHEPSVRRVEGLLKDAEAAGLRPETWSSLRYRGGVPEGDVLVVDRVGLLAGLYPLSHVAVVGGGFGAGVHNVLEPASLGLPVLFGPRHEKSHEARHLVREGGARPVTRPEALEEAVVELLRDEEARAAMGARAAETVRKNLDATGRTLAVLRSTFPALFPPPRTG
jgi:3-deoxy-D-manno-octulosonic-acid transferase